MISIYTLACWCTRIVGKWDGHFRLQDIVGLRVDTGRRFDKCICVVKIPHDRCILNERQRWLGIWDWGH